MNFFKPMPAQSCWQGYLFKKFLAMKIMTVLLFACMQVMATVKAQRITVNAENAPLLTVMQQVEKQSGHRFIYKDALLKPQYTISVTLNEPNLSAALDKLFANLPISYNIVGKSILLGEKKNNTKQAPQKKIRGKITNAQGQAMPGVSIKVKETGVTTISDTQGNYTIEASEKQTLLITYLGYETREVTIGQASEINVSLIETVALMNEVSIVSTGFQSIPKERATGSFAQVNNELLERRVSPNLIDRLEGVVSGLIFNGNFVQRSGNDSPYNIRGLSTIFANANPLIVVDNFPYDGDITNINPNDIESVTVLKDAAAASIWGARSGNGVIVITTKKGKANKPVSISFNANTTFSEKPDIYYSRSFLNSDAYIEAEKFLFTNGYYNSNLNNTTTRPLVSPVVEILAQQRSGAITEAKANELIAPYRSIDIREDYTKYLYQSTVAQQYAININGGGANSSYYFSGGYDNIPATSVGNSRERITLNSSASYQPLKGLELTTGLNYLLNNRINNAISVTPGNSKITYYPYAQLADDAGNPLALQKDYRYSYINSLGTNQLLDWGYRPLEEQGFADNSSKQNYLRFNVGLSYKIIKGLSAEVKYQLEKQNTIERNLQTQDSYYTRNLINLNTAVSGTTVTRPVPLGGILDQGRDELTGNSLRAQLNLNRTFGDKHELNAITGIDGKELIVDQNNWRLYGYNTGIGTTTTVDYNTLFPKYSNLASAAKLPYPDRIDKATDEYFSYFANASYAYLKKYTISASGRIDQSNLFGVNTNQKSVPLWSVGGAWDISKETFFKNRYIDYLKLRATYGYNGNIDKSVSAFTTAIASSNNPLTGANYVTILNPPNPELRWEQIGVFNVGLDFALVKKVLSGSIEYYSKRGRDIIGFAPVDPTTGVIEYKGNVADISGQGIDIELNIQTGNTIKWNSTLLFSKATDKIVRYEKTMPISSYIQYGDGAGGTFSLTPIVGKPILSVYSYKWSGLDPANGDPQGYLNGDVSKNYAGISNSRNIDEAVFHGSARPTVFGAFRNSFSYKNIQLSFNIIYKLRYYFKKPTINYNTLAASWQGNADFNSRWQKTGDELTTQIPSFAYPLNTARESFYQNSEVNVEKGDHIRLQDIQVSYQFTKGKLPFGSIQLFGYANNLGILWKHTKTSIDPDYINSLFISPRTYAIGLRASL